LGIGRDGVQIQLAQNTLLVVIDLQASQPVPDAGRLSPREDSGETPGETPGKNSSP
jgi:hypothetical protein